MKFKKFIFMENVMQSIYVHTTVCVFCILFAEEHLNKHDSIGDWFEVEKIKKYSRWTK